MSKKILSTYLKSFTEDEKKSFLDYLNSPIFPISNRTRSIETYEYLLNHHAPEFDYKEIDIEKIQKKLGFTNVKNVFTSLMHSVEDFLSFDKYQGQRHDKAIYLLQVLKEKDLNEIFTKRVDAYSADAWKDIDLAQEKFYHLFRVYAEYDTSFAKDGLDTSDYSHFHLHHFHDLHYTLVKLKSLMAHQTRSNTVDKEMVTDNYLELIQNVESSENPNFILQLYILLFRFAKETETKQLKENYLRFKNLYFDNIDEIPKNDKNELYIGLTNYCQKINKLDSSGFLDELFTLYRLGYEHRALFFDNIIHYYLFFNIIQIATERAETEWAEEFLKNTSKHLAAKVMKPTVLLSKAYILSNTYRCSEALEFLIQIEIKDVFITLTSKVLMIRCYYELKEMYALSNFLKTYQNYIRRQKKLSESAKKRYLKFSSTVTKMMKVNSTSDKKAIQRSIVNDDKLIYKSWLARMANQL